MPSSITPRNSAAETVTTRVLLIDEHTAFRQALAVVLQQELNCAVVGQIATVTEGLATCRDTDLIVVDLDLGQMQVAHFVAAMSKVNPQAKVIALASADNPAAPSWTTEASVVETLSKAAGIAKLLDTVRRLGPRALLAACVGGSLG